MGQAMCHAMAWELQKELGTATVESGWTVASMLGPGLSGLLWRDHFELGRYVLGPHALACMVLASVQVLPLPFLPPETLQRVRDSSLPHATYGSAESDVPSRFAAHVDIRLIGALALNAVGVFVNSAMDEVNVLFAVGALDFSEKNLGQVFPVAGVLDLFLQNVLWRGKSGRHEQTLALMRTTALLALVPCLIIPPLILPRVRFFYSRSFGLALSIVARKILSFLFNVTNTSLLNTSAEQMHALGLVHGWRLATASLSQIAGPLLGATVYAWSATAVQRPPFGEGFTFFCASLCVVGMACMSITLQHKA